jgi:hypothetical protein
MAAVWEDFGAIVEGSASGILSPVSPGAYVYCEEGVLIVQGSSGWTKKIAR